MVAGEGSAAAWKDMQPGLDTVGCGKLKDRGPVGIKAHPQRSTTSIPLNSQQWNRTTCGQQPRFGMLRSRCGAQRNGTRLISGLHLKCRENGDEPRFCLLAQTLRQPCPFNAHKYMHSWYQGGFIKPILLLVWPIKTCYKQ
jgi:hypothetical protein